MILSFFILMRTMETGELFPVLAHDENCPAPTFVVVAKNESGKINGSLTPEEWIEKYASSNQTDKTKLQFVSLTDFSV